MNSGIYKITCNANNKIYIGSAIDLMNRKKTHFRSLKRNDHYNKHLQNSYNKYGLNSFKFIILEYVTPSKLITQEQYWMDKLNPEFNICRVAGSPLGCKASDETKAKISKSRKGKPLSITHMNNTSKGKKGKKVGWAIGGNKHTKETKIKMGGRVPPNRIDRDIDVYNLNGVLIHCFSNTREAKKVLGAERGAKIHACCRKNMKQPISHTKKRVKGRPWKIHGYSYHGYIYKYAEEGDD